MKRRFAIAISAMMLAMPQAEGASAAGPSIEQLEIIQGLLERNDVEELRGYIAANPELLEGYGALAQLLLQFLAESADVIRYLSLGSSGDDDDPEAAPVVPLY